MADQLSHCRNLRSQDNRQKMRRNALENNSGSEWEEDCERTGKKSDEAAASKSTTIKRKRADRGRDPHDAKQKDGDTVKEVPEHIDVLIKAQEKSTKCLQYAIRRANKITERTYQKLHGQLQTKDVEIERLKEIASQRVAGNVFMAEPDDFVQVNLKDRLAKIKGWVKRYGVDNRSSILDYGTKTEVVKFLETGPYPSTSGAAMDVLFKQGVSITTLLHAVVTKHLLDWILNDRFFFTKSVDISQDRVDVSSAIDTLYAWGEQRNSNRAMVWLSQTMAMLEPDSSDVPRTDSFKQVPVAILKMEQYKLCAKWLLHSERILCMLKPLEPVEERSRRQELMSIICSVGDYLLKLGTQKVKMIRLAFDKLNHVSFNRNSEAVKPHPTLKIDEEDTSWDGNRILLVVEAGIRAYGNEEGTNYGQHKTWNPATVIVQIPGFELNALSMQSGQNLMPERSRTGTSNDGVLIKTEDDIVSHAEAFREYGLTGNVPLQEADEAPGISCQQPERNSAVNVGLKELAYVDLTGDNTVSDSNEAQSYSRSAKLCTEQAKGKKRGVNSNSEEGVSKKVESEHNEYEHHASNAEQGQGIPPVGRPGFFTQVLIDHKL